MGNGTYRTVAHGEVRRYRCRRCGRGVSDQSESIHYYAKRRLDLTEIFSHLRGGSSLRDIGREIGCSRTAIATATVRLGRQAMAAHARLVPTLADSRRLCFDGLVSALACHDYPTQITTLGDRDTELLLAMSHCVTERGGRRTARQLTRLRAHRRLWRPRTGALIDSISLLVSELPRFASRLGLRIDTDEHPLYATVLAGDHALGWWSTAGTLSIHRTPSTAARDGSNPLFLMNYLDRMIRHRMKEHTRESIALGRNATMQMLRMWIFAWDHNARQPIRVKGGEHRSRFELAGIDQLVLGRLRQEFTERRLSLRGVPVSHSIREVWLGELDTPPVRWKRPQRSRGPSITDFAGLDLAFADPQGQ